MNSIRYWTVVGLMLAAFVVLHVRGDVDKVPVFQPLTQFPPTINGWTATDIPMDPEALETLGKGYFLNRSYHLPDNAAIPEVGLFIGYFPTQRTGQAIHSPQHCLPGAGWTFDSSGVTKLKVPGAPDIEVGEYVISNGPSKDEVLYWYRSHGRAVADDYKAKLYTLSDSIRYGRTDAALVRVVTPIGKDEDLASAHKRAVVFAEAMNAQLPPYIPE